MKTKQTIVAFALMLLCATTSATWNLIPDKSFVSFISTKKEHLAEAHTFKHVKGSVDEAGNAELVIDLASVDTKVDIRDQRMRKYLFEIGLYPSAVYKAHIDSRRIVEMTLGDSEVFTINGELDLHGISQQIDSQALITKTGINKLKVASIHPIIINAKDFNLVKGVEKLRELVNLSSISLAVPVTYVLTFEVVTP